LCCSDRVCLAPVTGRRPPGAPLPPWLHDIRESLAPLLTVVEVAEVLRQSPETVRRACRAGKLRAVQQHTGRGGSPLLIPRDAVIEWLRQRELRPGS
jgi:excisionase family DNA binding protein